MTSRVPAIFDVQDPCSPLSIPNSQTALLLLDYQNLSIAAMGDAGAKAVATAGLMQKWAFDSGIMVVHCLVDTKSGESPKPSMKAAGRVKVLQEKLQNMPALGDEHEGLSKIAEDEKTDARRLGYISALEGPRIREMLDGVKSLILGGISTSGCLLSTCRAATDAEYIVTVVEDACADPVPGLHDMLMQHVISSTAHVCKCAELIEIWKSKA
jgi:nicotinamidase-related amidase